MQTEVEMHSGGSSAHRLGKIEESSKVGPSTDFPLNLRFFNHRGLRTSAFHQQRQILGVDHLELF